MLTGNEFVLWLSASSVYVDTCWSVVFWLDCAAMQMVFVVVAVVVALLLWLLPLLRAWFKR